MRFKTTKDIFVDNTEYFNQNWMDSNVLITPDHKKWDYKKDMHIEDVDIWEVIYEASGGIGIYASWSPYAEFYLIRRGWEIEIANGLETYYGAGAELKVLQIIKELGLNISTQKRWVEIEEMWLHEKL